MYTSASTRTDNFEDIYEALSRKLTAFGAGVEEPPHQMGKLKGNPLWTSIELTNVVFELDIPDDPVALQLLVRPNLPWAEDHFQERVSGIPHNPPPSSEWWPFAQRGNEDHKDLEGKFSHTYPERFWARNGDETLPPTGIRFKFGDLNDLVKLLGKEPNTRQAHLPIWFPEDLTAANLGERVPCTLGYHFLLRDDVLSMTYFIRSCDFIRYFRDDVYMACRLVQWVSSRLEEADVMAQPGVLTMHIVSLHCFEGDVPRLRKLNALGRT